MSESENTVDLSEVYFLIAHFLADSPLASAAKVLKEELEQKQLLPKRIDWRGVEHEQKFSDVAIENKDVAPSHLVSLLESLNTLLNRHEYTALPGLNSLLTLTTEAKVKQGDGVKLVSTTGCAARFAEFHLSHHGSLVGKNFAPSLLTRQYCSNLATNNLLTPSFYTTVKKLVSVLGHLAPVYCCMYDRTGHRIITGADDCLVKVWSSHDGRLLATLRGHSGEVSDIAISYNNSLIASGSTDKTIRVWCAQTSAPVTVLTGHHGTITSVQFSPISYEDSRGLLTSTSSDGHLFIWSYNTVTNEFEKLPQKIMEKTRIGDQTVCSAYSPGGHYFVTGGTDHVVRVYKMYPIPIPEPSELVGHSDRIMIVKFGHTSSGLFATGSRDGTARVWSFKSGQWESVVLQMPKQPNIGEDVYHKHKLQVTMVGWEWTDHYIITASTPDCNLYIWDVQSATILHTLKGHFGEMFVVEPHPLDSRILLSAGHDGLLKIWDMFTGECIKTFHNMYEEEDSDSSVFDCHFSPDGLTFAASDALGHLILFGFGDEQHYQKFPEEQFFHTDYRPLLWDRDNNVLDEQSQRPPHLMPPPYLVDIDGHPHPLKGQNVILELIRPPTSLQHIKKEVLEGLVDYDEFMKQRQVQLSGENKHSSKLIVNCLSSTCENNYVHRSNGDCLYDNQPCGSRTDDKQFVQSQNSGVAINNSATSSNSGPVKMVCCTVRDNKGQSGGKMYSQGVTVQSGGVDGDYCSCNGVNELTSSVDHQDRTIINAYGEQCVDLVNNHTMVTDQSMINTSADSLSSQRVGNTSQATVSDHTPVVSSQAAVNDQSTDTANNSEDINIMEFDNSDQSGGVVSNNNILTSIVWSCGLSNQEAKSAVSLWLSRAIIPVMDSEVYGLQRSRLNAHLSDEIEFHERELSKAAQKLPVTIDLDNEFATRAQGKSLRSGKLLPDILAAGLGGGAEPFVEEENAMDNISVSDSEEDDGFNHWTSNEGSYVSSSDVSDWTMEAAINIVSQGRKSTRRHRTRLHNSSNSGGEEFNMVINEDEPAPSFSAEQNLTSRISKTSARYKPYLPTDWLKQTTPKTSPYFPQVGDLVVYCRQGHELYIQEVRQKRLNYFLKGQKLPWQKYLLEPHELCQVTNVCFVVGPPTVCSITLSMIQDVVPHDAPSASVSVPKTFSFKYHDIDDVPDFLILASHFCSSVCQPWKEGMKFQSFIEGKWWIGTVVCREPCSGMYPESLWQCYVVQWDDDNISDTLSPWDMETLPSDEQEGATVGTDLTVLNSFPWRYVEQGDEWAPNGFDVEQQRIVNGIDVVMETLEEAAPFKEPVDLELYPDYCVAVAMPTDLLTIKTKLMNKFYLRKTALLWEVNLLYRNTLAYNEDDSLIVKHAKIVALTLKSFISDSSSTDVMSCYQPNRTINDVDIVINDHSSLANDEIPDQPARPKRSRQLVSVGDSGDEVARAKRSKDEPEWMSHARHLLNTVSSHHCAIPFLEPVDSRRFTDYRQYVKQPMDLSSVLMKLETSQYIAPADFILDIRLIFSNSKLYNSHPKNQIHQMAIKLEDYFEEHVVRFLTQCGGTEMKYATRGAISKVASSAACMPTKRKISSSNEEEDEADIDDEEEEEEEEYEEDEDDVKDELLSLCDDDEIDVEDEQKKTATPRKSPRKKYTSTVNCKMTLRTRPHNKSRHKQPRHRRRLSSPFSCTSDSDSEHEDGWKGKDSAVIITSHGRRVKPNTRLKH